MRALLPAALLLAACSHLPKPGPVRERLPVLSRGWNFIESEKEYLRMESGVDPVGDGWAQTPIRYYVFALLFVMFDVEAVFIFPWATRLEAYGWFGAIEMIAFILLLALGLLYAWRKKVLQWI